MFRTSGTGHGMIAKELARQGVQRRVALAIPNFFGAEFVVERTDLLMIIPLRLAELLRGRGDFRILPLPFSIPPCTVK